MAFSLHPIHIYAIYLGYIYYYVLIDIVSNFHCYWQTATFGILYYYSYYRVPAVSARSKKSCICSGFVTIATEDNHLLTLQIHDWVNMVVVFFFTILNLFSVLNNWPIYNICAMGCVSTLRIANNEISISILGNIFKTLIAYLTDKHYSMI